MALTVPDYAALHPGYAFVHPHAFIWVMNLVLR
jgi:hypothetical protein